MGTYENRIQHKGSQLGWNAMRIASVANKFGIPGASETALSKSFNGVKDLPSVETALPLDLLLGRFLKMYETFRPFPLNLNDIEQAKQLLEDFEAGRIAVSITHQEPGTLIHSVFVIENRVTIVIKPPAVPAGTTNEIVSLLSRVKDTDVLPTRTSETSWKFPPWS